MTPGIFLTGTSTGVGKTLVTVAMLRMLASANVRAVGLKPVATGGQRSLPGAPLRNADALELQAASPCDLPYEAINPFCFEPAIAPHIAAEEAGVAIPVAGLAEWYATASAAVDIALVEGAGGWRVPLHPTGFLSDFPERLGLGVILVVGLTLGCLNHAALTADSIARGGRCRLLGWVGNSIDPVFERPERNIETLAALLGTRALAIVPWLGTQVPTRAMGAMIAEWHGAAGLAEVVTAQIARPS